MNVFRVKFEKDKEPENDYLGDMLVSYGFEVHEQKTGFIRGDLRPVTYEKVYTHEPKNEHGYADLLFVKYY